MTISQNITEKSKNKDKKPTHNRIINPMPYLGKVKNAFILCRSSYFILTNMNAVIHHTPTQHSINTPSGMTKNFSTLWPSNNGPDSRLQAVL